MEQDVLEELNRARANPKAYAKVAEALTDRFDGKRLRWQSGIKVQTKEGPKAVKQAVKALKKTRPLAPLQLSGGLSKAAKDHVQDQGPKGALGHKGSNRESLTDRVASHGVWVKKLGENISYGMPLGREVVLQLLVDDGVKGRGHRRNIMDPAFTKVGVACGVHKRYRTMCVLDFAGDFLESLPLQGALIGR